MTPVKSNTLISSVDMRPEVVYTPASQRTKDQLARDAVCVLAAGGTFLASYAATVAQLACHLLPTATGLLPAIVRNHPYISLGIPLASLAASYIAMRLLPPSPIFVTIELRDPAHPVSAHESEINALRKQLLICKVEGALEANKIQSELIEELIRVQEEKLDFAEQLFRVEKELVAEKAKNTPSPTIALRSRRRIQHNSTV